METNTRISSVEDIDQMISNPHPWWLAHKGSAVLGHAEMHVRDYDNGDYSETNRQTWLILRNARTDLRAVMDYLDGIAEVGK